MQYLDEDDPSDRLKEEVDGWPHELKQISWDISLYATFEVSPEFSPQMPSLIDRIVRQYFALLENYDLTYRIEKLGG